VDLITYLTIYSPATGAILYLRNRLVFVKAAFNEHTHCIINGVMFTVLHLNKHDLVDFRGT